MDLKCFLVCVCVFSSGSVRDHRHSSRLGIEGVLDVIFPLSY